MSTWHERLLKLAVDDSYKSGVMAPAIDQLTVQGFDLTFGTNVIGHFYLTKLLLPALLVGAKSNPDTKARVVNTSSCMSRFTNTIDFNTFNDTRARKRKGRHMLYSQSKLVSTNYIHIVDMRVLRVL